MIFTQLLLLMVLVVALVEVVRAHLVVAEARQALKTAAGYMDHLSIRINNLHDELFPEKITPMEKKEASMQ
jgi:hypothetical protein